METNRFNIGALIAKAMDNRLTEEEAKRLADWLGQSEANRKLMESIQSSETLPTEVEYIRRLDLDGAWDAIRRKRSAKRSGTRGKWLSAAAAILVVGALSFWTLSDSGINNNQEAGQLVSRWGEDLLPASSQATLVLPDGGRINLSDSTQLVWAEHDTQIDREEEERYNTLIVPKAGMFRFTLPDSSHVWLNSDSKLRFPVSFSKSERRVFLDGEAFFEIAGDASHPFVVDMRGTEITVLGTAFNVNTFSGVATTLVEGAVRVTTGSNALVMQPGQLAQVAEDRIVVGPADFQQALAWKNGEFYFRKGKIVDILDELSRWYGFDVRYEGKIPDKQYTGGIARNVRLSELLEMLGYVFRADFRIEGKSVNVHFKSE